MSIIHATIVSLDLSRRLRVVNPDFSIRVAETFAQTLNSKGRLCMSKNTNEINAI